MVKGVLSRLADDNILSIREDKQNKASILGPRTEASDIRSRKEAFILSLRAEDSDLSPQKEDPVLSPHI